MKSGTGKRKKGKMSINLTLVARTVFDFRSPWRIPALKDVIRTEPRYPRDLAIVFSILMERYEKSVPRPDFPDADAALVWVREQLAEFEQRDDHDNPPTTC